ncbi:DDI1-like protein [Pyrus ussuriensis x Pyrus communis]|uniref:DDI1-like protein n=1 Tax=Pyrus ussuriensis x Pyrus communis TaxID=2448454 RepID=A0A5N5G3F0_9ROSA|nr:DDI1-like protein [Pyrus ussuriensis x Pyrus communis]
MSSNRALEGFPRNRPLLASSEKANASCTRGALAGLASVWPPDGSGVNLKAFQQHIMKDSNLITQLNSLHVSQFIFAVFQLCEAQSYSDGEHWNFRIIEFP